MLSARLVLFVTIFVAMLGLSVLFPVLAPLARELGLTPFQVGAFSAAYSLMQFLCAPLWGARSERTGRKPVLLLGLLGFALSFALFGVVAALGLQGVLGGAALFALLLLTRIVGGALSSATLPTAQAYMADITDRDNRAAAMGMIGAALGLGIVFGPALGALLSVFGLLVPVFFSAALALVTALFAARSLPESRRTADDEDSPAVRRRELLTRPGVLLLLAVSGLYTLASVGMEQSIGFYVQDTLSISGTEATRAIGVMLTVFGLLAAAVQGSRVIFRRFRTAQLIVVGLAVMGAGMLLLAQATAFWTITAALGVVGIGSALLGPSLSAALSLSVGSREQGHMAGLGASALALGRLLGPLVGTGLYQYVSIQGPYLFSGILLLALLALVLGQKNAPQTLAARS